MPTVFYKFGFKFYFVSFDFAEPPHIHISDQAKKNCKFWLKNNRGVLAHNRGFNKRDISKIETSIFESYSLILKFFNEFCKSYKK